MGLRATILQYVKPETVCEPHKTILQALCCLPLLNDTAEANLIFVLVFFLTSWVFTIVATCIIRPKNVKQVNFNLCNNIWFLLNFLTFGRLFFCCSFITVWIQQADHFYPLTYTIVKQRSTTQNQIILE